MKYLLAAIVLIVSVPAFAADTSWPRFETSIDDPKCIEALKVATAVFKSDQIYLYAPPIIPENLESELVLGPSALDISGGDALKINEKAIQKIKKPDIRSIYWQIVPDHQHRIVLNEDAFGWRGDQYTLYSIPENITSGDFINGYDRNRREARFPAAIGENWRPPILFQSKAGEIWAIDVGPPWVLLSDWKIYANTDAGIKHACTIQFHPQKSLLPVEVRKFQNLLNSTLGKGPEEGTLQSTARLRIHAEAVWGNIAYRPWVGESNSYNTHEEVESGLKQWSGKSKSYLKVYQKIKAQYSKAQYSLAQYYKDEFHQTDKEAETSAAKAMDLGFRAYFIFTK